MSYYRHHAIVVTSWSADAINAAADKARGLAMNVVGPEGSVGCNGYQSFMVCPDGSKENWGDSDRGDAKRDSLVDWLEDQLSLNWVEVEFGGDQGGAKVVRAIEENE